MIGDFHRQIQHYRMPFEARAANLGGYIRCKRQVCEGDLWRQAQRTGLIDPVETHVIDNDGDPWSAYLCRARRPLGDGRKQLNRRCSGGLCRGGLCRGGLCRGGLCRGVLMFRRRLFY